MAHENEATEEPTPRVPGEGPDRRWRVLFISDHGKVFTFKRVKVLAGLTAAAFLLSLTAVAVLLAVNQRLHGRNRDLRERFKTVEQQVAQLHRERDLLTAQVVLVETRMREVLEAGARPRTGPKPPEANRLPAADVPGQAEVKEPAAAAPAPDPGSSLQHGAVETAHDPGIRLEELRVRHRRSRNEVALRVRVRNTNPARRPLAGNLVAVVKGKGLAESQWLALPSVPLKDGRPSAGKKGYPFSINHSITLENAVAAPRSLPGFDTAVLYVFSREGELLHTQEFPVDLGAAED